MATDLAPFHTPTRVLTLADRCDRCSAQAFVRVEIIGAMLDGPPIVTLQFCGHHYTKHEPALAAVAVGISDERSYINEKPNMKIEAEK